MHLRVGGTERASEGDMEVNCRKEEAEDGFCNLE